jgi:NitT/TauT family transport system substrate-binding protein
MVRPRSPQILEFSILFQQTGSNAIKEDLKMSFYDRPQTLLEHLIFVRRLGRLFCRKPLAIALTVVLLGFSAKASAQTIKVGYAALVAGQVAVWMAKEGGYLSKNGIDADLIYIPAVAATQALIAGEIQLAQVTGVSTAGAILAGADVRIIASVQDRLAGSIYARPEIKTPEDLKGKKIGISRFGAVSETAVAMFLARFGLKRGTDVAIIQLGGLPEVITAMDRGAVEAGFANPPQTARARRLGMKELFDLNALGVELQQTCLTVTTRYLREHRPVVKSFLQAYAEGLHRFITDRDYSNQVLKKYLRVDDKEILDDAYTFYSQRLQKIPYPTLKGIKFILNEMAEKQPRAKNVAPESFVDLSLLQELDQSGFFKQLWKN